MTKHSPPDRAQERSSLPMHQSARCGARSKRSGDVCRAPRVTGMARCRMHGGAAGSGAPTGERNGAWRGGGSSNEIRALRRELAAVVREASALLADF